MLISKDCRHYDQDSGVCRVAADSLGIEMQTNPVVCGACKSGPQPMDINCITLELAIGKLTQSQELDGSVLKKIKRVQQRRENQCGDDNRLAKVAGPIAAASRQAASKLEKGPGTELKKLLSWFASDNGSCGCNDRARIMNDWGPDRCEKNIDKIVGWIMDEGQKRGWPGGPLVEMGERKLVQLAISRSRKALAGHDAMTANQGEPIKDTDNRFTVAITTAPRPNPTLFDCVGSFRRAGWEPTVFAEPDTEPSNASTIENDERLGVWHNWLASARWAVDQGTEYVLTAQDDIILHPQSKRLVELLIEQRPEVFDGFLSLYTARHYGRKFFRTPGIRPVNTKSLWGACCLVWRREVLEQVITHPRAAKWIGASVRTKSARKRIYKRRRENPELIANSDTAIGKIVTQLGRKMYFVSPSPAQHVAKYSSITHGGNAGNRNCGPCAKQDAPLIEQVLGSG